MDVLKDVSKISRNLMLSEPFYGLFLSTLNKVLNKNIPTAGVCKAGINVQLSINPEFWSGLPENIRYGVLKHELLHICLLHIPLRDRYYDKKLFNIAADISINQMIDPKYKTDWFLHIKSFGDIGLEPLKDTDYYYKALQQEQQKNPNGQLAQFMQDDGGYDDSLANHEGWGEFDKLSETEKKLIQKQVEYQLKEVAQQTKSRGLIPGELSEIIDSLFNVEPPKFDWKSYLRRFAGGSTKVYTKKVRRKQSKRYEDNPGLKIKQKKHILVAIDTSGSVSDDELKEFMSEIYHIYKTDVKVTIIHADAKINWVGEYNGKFDGKIHGRGGKRNLCHHI